MESAAYESKLCHLNVQHLISDSPNALDGKVFIQRCVRILWLGFIFIWTYFNLRWEVPAALPIDFR